MGGITVDRDRLIALTKKYEGFVEAAEKIEKNYERDLFFHAMWCNYQRPGLKWCNCGLADLLTALDALRKVGG